MKKYIVTLTIEEREQLQALIAAGKAAAKKLAHARILLKADAAAGGPACDDQRIAEAVEVSTDTVGRVRQRFVEYGLEAALGRKKQERPSRARKLDGRAEARLIALACSAPPTGRKEWTMKLLADKLVELDIVDTISDEKVRRTLKKTSTSPGIRNSGASRRQATPNSFARMEDVLAVYHRPSDAKRPLVCLDEASKQLISETRTPLPPEPGRPERFDYEYVRNGTANLFMISEPLLGWRHVTVTERRTAEDFAEVVQLVGGRPACRRRHGGAGDGQPQHTHKLASLYEAFPPERARRIAERLEIHHTPKHGSWLNMAEIELSVLAGQCLDCRLESTGVLKQEVEAWELERNERMVEVKWQFTTAEARIKLRHLYPVLQ